MLRVHCATPDLRTTNTRTNGQRGCLISPYSYGGHSGGETPGHIPNPEAKPSSADGTAPERVWESRTPPNTPNVEGRTQPCGPRRISHPRPTIAHAIRKDGTVAPPPPRDQGRPGDRAGGTGRYRRAGGT